MKASTSASLRAQQVSSYLSNAFIWFHNRWAKLAGSRPEAVILPLHGSYPARTRKLLWWNVFSWVGSKESSLESFSHQVSRLCDSPWIERIILMPEGLELQASSAFALRQQLLRLRQAGKHSSIYLERLDLLSYYLASACDSIVMPPSGEIFLLGIGLERTFMRDALERWGLAFDKLAIRRYKNAFDELVRQEMSEAQREQLEQLLSSLDSSILGSIAESRQLSSDTLQQCLQQPVISSEAAQAQGLIDRVAYPDDLLNDKQQYYRDVGRFLWQRPRTAERSVAVISLEGIIVPGQSQRSPFPLPLVGEAQAGSETLQRAFRAAAQDDSIGAIVFHVDSGGGSALASDIISQALRQAKKQKPVVAVMGSVAASGGYYVLSHADHIVAAPTTITGSIGVLLGKLVLEQFYARYGFNVEVIRRHPYALAFSSSRAFSEAEREWLERYMVDVYERFVGHVATGRNLSLEAVHARAEGRIWSGIDAQAQGLVDELGDIDLAIQRAKERAKLSPHAPVRNVYGGDKPLLPEQPQESLRAFLANLQALQREQALLLSTWRVQA